MMGDRLSMQRILALAGVVLLIGAGLSFGPAVAQDGGDVELPPPSNDGNTPDPYDCDDFSSAEQARTVLANEAPDDTSGLDTNDNGIPCEDDFPDQTEPVTAAATDTPAATPTEEPTSTETATPTETVTSTETATPSGTETDTATPEETAETEAEQPTASVNFENQTTDGTTVVVESVTMSEGGFIAIHNASLLDGNVLGSVVGVSEPLPAGTHENVEVTLFNVPGQGFAEDMTLEESQTLIAMPHFDTNSNGVYDFITSNGSEDGAYTENGSAVVDPASITVEDGAGGDDDGAAQGDELGQNDEDDDGDGHVDEDGEDGDDVPSNDDDDGDGAIDEDDEPDDGDDGSDDFNGEAEDDDDGDGHFDEDDEADGGNSDDEDNDGDGAVDEDDEPDNDD